MLVVYGSLVPVPEPPSAEHGDKLVHMAAYGALMGWFSSLYVASRRRIGLAIALMALGVALEFVQGLTGYRSQDVYDMLANSIGVMLGWLMAPPRLPNVLELVERWLRK